MQGSLRTTSGRLIALAAAAGSVVASSLFLVAPARAQNLLSNGDFNVDADADNQPDGWFSWTFGDTAFAAYKNDPANDRFDYDGTAYVNAGNYGEWWTSGGGWFQVVAGAADVAYSLSTQCATEDWDNAAGEIRIVYTDAENAELRRDVYHTAEFQASMPWSLFELTSVAPAGTMAVKAEIATWGARGAVLWDNLNLTTASVWKDDTSGSWFTGERWIGGSPNGTDVAARFLGAITADQTVAIDSPVTLGSLGFDNANTHVLAGAGSVTLQTSGGPALVDVKQGTQQINLPLTIASNTQLHVVSGATLKISDPLTIAAGKSLAPTGAGVVLYESSIDLQNDASIVLGNSTSAASLTLASGAKAQLTPHGIDAAKTLSVTSLSLASGATLDLADNSMVIDYTGPAGTLENDVRLMISDGRITSSVAGTPSGTKLGYADNGAVDADSLLIKFTYAGDANLDGQVTISDLGDLASNWQSTSALWRNGDFNYDGQVTISDLGDLASNWQAGVGSPLGMSFQEALAAVGFDGAAVPEPAAVAALAAASLFVRRRRC